jgi:hypothetical protein
LRSVDFGVEENRVNWQTFDLFWSTFTQRHSGCSLLKRDCLTRMEIL